MVCQRSRYPPPLQTDYPPPARHNCTTQQTWDDRHTAIQLGMHGHIYILNPKTTLRYHILHTTFETKKDSEHAATCFAKAIEAWTPIPVRFQHVNDPTTAHFYVVGCETNEPETYANAFFPNGLHDPYRQCVVKIYPLAFQHRDVMVNILTHEIGHILGLRHEFASEEEEGIPCVRFGERNPDSVMGYYNYDDSLQMAVHGLDIEQLLGVYRYVCDLGNTEFKGFPITLVDPDARVKIVGYEFSSDACSQDVKM
ncbi:hypothetical protein AA313_de0201742 [Arthrobotrys entomopaga]|nr:hypothetical protein AA313_de0201742 [Arthrobotrys entomopaga]